MLVRKLLEEQRPNLYWTLYAAHCIDLILEDIGKIPRIVKTLERVIQLIRYIYNHGGCVKYVERIHKPNRAG